MENQKDLPLPQTDLLTPEKEIPAHFDEKQPLLKSKWLKIGVFAVILLFLIGGAYMFGKNNSSTIPIPPPDEPKYQSPTPNPTESPKTFTITKTAKGKLLTETKYGFSFEFDNNLKECCGISGPTSGEVIVALGDIPDDDAGSDRPFDGFSVTVIPNPNNLTFARYIDSEKAAFKKMGRDVPLVKSAINLGELSGGFLFKDSTFGNNIYYFPFPDGKNFISFGQTRETVNFDGEFVKILSTFKFTE